MRDQDYEAFADLWQAAWEAAGRSPTPAVIEFAFGALADCEFPAMRAALIAHARDPDRGRYIPKPADILYQLETMRGSDGRRPGPDEAWALLAHDERNTCVWTEEMQSAYGIAAALLAEGDRIAARMAFKDAYEREVRRAQAEQRPIRWSVSLGWDKAGRETPIREALERGRLSPQQAMTYLPAPADEPATEVVALAQNIGKRARG